MAASLASLCNPKIGAEAEEKNQRTLMRHEASQKQKKKTVRSIASKSEESQRRHVDRTSCPPRSNASKGAMQDKTQKKMLDFRSNDTSETMQQAHQISCNASNRGESITSMDAHVGHICCGSIRLSCQEAGSARGAAQMSLHFGLHEKNSTSTRKMSQVDATHAAARKKSTTTIAPQTHSEPDRGK